MHVQFKDGFNKSKYLEQKAKAQKAKAQKEGLRSTKPKQPASVAERSSTMEPVSVAGMAITSVPHDGHITLRNGEDAGHEFHSSESLIESEVQGKYILFIG